MLTATRTAADLNLAPMPAAIQHAQDEKAAIHQRREDAYQAGQAAHGDYARHLADGNPDKAAAAWAKAQALELANIAPAFNRLAAAADEDAQAAARAHIIEIAPKARAAFNTAAEAFTAAYHELGAGRISPVDLIRNEHSAKLWRDLTAHGATLDGHAIVINAAAEAGAGVTYDNGATLADRDEDRTTRYAAGLAHPYALRDTDQDPALAWTRTADLAPIGRWLRILHAQGRNGRPQIKALEPTEQRREIDTLRGITQAWTNSNGGGKATIADFAIHHWAQHPTR